MFAMDNSSLNLLFVLNVEENALLRKTVPVEECILILPVLLFYLLFIVMQLVLRKVEAVNSESPLENGLPPKEDEDDMGQNVRELAAKVVDDVVKMASEAAQQRTADQNSTPTKNKGFNLQRLPTIQIDTVPSAPSSPVDLTPPNESNEDEPVSEEPLNESDIQLELDTVEQETESSSEDLREFLKSYIEDILSEAMVLAEKKLQFAGLPDDEEQEEQEEDEDRAGPSSEPAQSTSQAEEIIDDSEIRATAERVVQEVISKASETAADKLENGIAGLSFPGLPSFQIDTVKSAPPSPESEEEEQAPQKRWSFKVDEASYTKKKAKPQQVEKKAEPQQQDVKRALIKFDDAPEDVKEAATSFVKEIVGRAIAVVEEKTPKTVPFNFEDVNLMKTSGPWYIRAREALIRLLRSACFCTPRRTDS